MCDGKAIDDCTKCCCKYVNYISQVYFFSFKKKLSIVNVLCSL